MSLSHVMKRRRDAEARANQTATAQDIAFLHEDGDEVKIEPKSSGINEHIADDNAHNIPGQINNGINAHTQQRNPHNTRLTDLTDTPAQVSQANARRNIRVNPTGTGFEYGELSGNALQINGIQVDTTNLTHGYVLTYDGQLGIFVLGPGGSTGGGDEAYNGIIQANIIDNFEPSTDGWGQGNGALEFKPNLTITNSIIID